MVVLALIVCQTIRSHLLEWYLVPSSSMEPTLHGDEVSGDLVLVDKTAFWRARPDRFDMVVLQPRDESESHYLVKRVVAFGDDRDNLVRIDGGDVFVGSSKGDLHRLVKDPLRARAMRLTNFAFPGPGRTKLGEYFHPGADWRIAGGAEPVVVVRPGGRSLEDLRRPLHRQPTEARRRRDDLFLPGHMSTRVPVDTTFLRFDGEPLGACELYRDIGMELTFVPGAGCGGVQLVLEYLDRYYAFAYRRDGEVGFSVMGEADAAVHGRGPAFGSGPASLSFGYLDGWFFLEVGGVLVCHFERALPLERPPSADGRLGNHDLLHLAAWGGELRVPRIRVFHDVYYQALPGVRDVYRLEPGTMFLLGDNTFDSNDSRRGHRYFVADLVGRPIAVIGPLARQHWLRR